MRTNIKRIMSLLLICIIAFTGFPISKAAVGVDNTVVGILNDYVIAVVLDGDGEWISKITINNNEYSVQPRLISLSEAQKAKGKKVACVLSNEIVTSFNQLSYMKSSPQAYINNMTNSTILSSSENIAEITYINGRFDYSSFCLEGVVKNFLSSKVEATWGADFFVNNNLSKIENISITLQLENTDILHFKDNLPNITIDLDSPLAVGESEFFKCKIYTNKDYKFNLEDKNLQIPVQCFLKAERDGVEFSSNSKYIISIVNNDYGVKLKKWQKKSVKELFVEMRSALDKCPFTVLSPSERIFLNSFFTGVISSELFELQKTNLEMVDTVYEFNCYFFEIKYFGIKEAGELFLETLKEQVIKEEETIKTLLAEIFQGYADSEAFSKFIKWYDEHLSNVSGESTSYTVKCPVDITVKNDDGEVVLSIINNVIELCDDNVSAFIVDDEKIFYLPTNAEYLITTTATDNGTMDYIVSEYTPGGNERTIEYNDVSLAKGESYTSLAPQKTMLSSDVYNLVNADGDEIECDYDSLPPVEDNITDVVVSEELFDGFSKELIDKVANVMFNFESVVDITNYHISTDDTVALFSAIAKYYPTEYSLLSKSDFTYKIIFSPSLGCISDIRFYYGEDANLSDYQKRVNDLNAEIDKIVAQVEGMDDFEKALYIHDYIVLNSEYDLELLEILETQGTLDGELRSERYTEYSILINGTGVCGSYALAYRALMNAANVECLYLSSRQMNHAWNLVKIDGEWFHVDCCWDDPVPNQFGVARRTYFLRTDTEIMELNHYSWEPGKYKASSTKYSRMPRNYDCEQKYDLGYWYVVNYNNIIRTDRYGTNEEIVADISATSIDVEDGELYYSNENVIYRYDVSVENDPMAVIVNKANSMSNYIYIKNLYVNNDSIVCYGAYYDQDSTLKYFKRNEEIKEDIYSSISGISLDKTEINLDISDKTVLAATIISETAIDGLILNWSSSDSEIVTVDENGNIYAKKAGKAQITVNVGNFLASCVVTVNGPKTGVCGENLTWKLTSDGELFIYGTGDMYDVDIEYSDTPWLHLRESIKKVTICNGVTSIGDFAFVFCDRIEAITIPNSVVRIGNNSFHSCYALKEIEIPKSVLTIGEKTFAFCHGLTEINIPGTVRELGTELFDECQNLKTVIIGEGIKELSMGMFEVCPSLNSVSLPKSLTCISAGAFVSCTALKKIIVPNGVTCIETHAFAGCTSLESVYLPATLADISQNAFLYCDSLNSVHYLDNKEKWNEISVEDGNNTLLSADFYFKTSHMCGDNLYWVLTDEGELIISGSGDMYDWAQSIDVPWYSDYLSINSVIFTGEATSIGDNAFEGCSNLAEVELPGTITRIGENSFACCEYLTEVIIPDSVLDIGENAFASCRKLTSIKLPNQITSIADRTFNNCINLSNIIIPDGVVSIGEFAFESCLSIDNVVLPNSIINIGKGAFYECSSLKNINIPEKLSVISDYTFSNCISLNNIKITNNISSVGECAFFRCTGLENVIIGSNVKSIGFSAFACCENLVMVTIDNSAADIGAGAFMYCYGLQDLELGDNILSIGESAFSGCKKIYNLIIPKSVKSIDINAFEDCNNLLHVGYTGTQDDWNNILIDESNTILLGVKYLHCDFEPSSDIAAHLAVKGTCVKKGHTEGIYCSDCDLWFSGEFTDKAPDVHNYQLDSSTSGNCITPSNETFKCTDCGYSYTKTIDADYCHLYTETIIEPTCTEIGYTVGVCEDCGESVMYDFVSAKGHAFEFTYNAATCQEYSSTVKQCKDCDYSESHNDTQGGYASHNICTTDIEATCVEDGCVEQVCISCNTIISSEIISASGHTPGEWQTTIEPTNDSAGRREKYCTVCTELIEEEILPKLPVDVSGITLNKTEVEIKNKETYQLLATVTPDNADDKSLSWQSDNTEVATVDDNGMITAISVGNATITAITTDGGYTASCKLTVTPRSFKVTWIVDGNETIDNISEGSKITLPNIPTKTGYAFDSWTPKIPEIMPAEDRTFTATWKAKSYIATFNANGGKWSDNTTDNRTVAVDYETDIPEQEIPKKQGFVFSGWEYDSKNLGVNVGKMTSTNGMLFTAIWSPASNTTYTVKTYTMDENGKYNLSETVCTGTTNEMVTVEPDIECGFELNKEKSVLSGEVASDNSLVLKVYIDRKTFTLTTVADGIKTSIDYLYGATIEKPAVSEKRGFTFAGWDGTIPEVMPAENLTFYATWNRNSYGVTWVVDGIESKQTYKFEDKIIVPENPTKEGHSFKNWGQVIPDTMPAENLTFTAQWDVNSYNVIWIVDDVETKKSFNYGSAIKLPETPTKIGHTFAGWDNKIPDSMPANDLTFTAQWTVNSYNVTWVVDDKETKEIYTYGSVINKHSTPAKTGYTFSGWNNKIPATMPANDLTFTAQWSINSYDVIWIVDGVETKQSYNFGDKIVVPEAPIKEGHTFISWSKVVPDTMPAENLTFTAVWDTVAYDVTWFIDGVKVTESYNFGSAINEPAMPTKTGHTFAGWDNKVPVTMPAKGLIFTAQWTVNSYDVIWIVDGIETKQTYQYGAEVTALATPIKEGYTFIGWSKQIPKTMPAENITVTALWQVNNYTVTWNIDGDTIVNRVEFGVKIVEPSVPEKVGYKFVGWDSAIPSTMPAHNLIFVAQYELIVKQLKIKNPSTNTVKYGDTLVMHADLGGVELPEGWTIEWTVEGASFSTKVEEDGLKFKVTSISTGNVTVTSTLVDENGEVVKDVNGKEMSDSKQLTSKACFWQKFISFFKNLFGISRIILQSI